MTDAPDADTDAPDAGGAPEAPDAAAGALTVEVTALPDPLAALGDVAKAITRHPRVRVDYPGADLWLVNLDVVDKDPGEDARFRAVMSDMASGRVVEATGRLGRPDSVAIHPTGREHLPRDDEHAWALEVVRHDEELAAALDAGEVEAYRPLPPLASEPHVDGTAQRAVTVGLRRPGGGPRHRVVAARVVDGEVIADPVGVHPPSDDEAGVAPAPEAAGGGGAGEGSAQVRVQVRRGGELVWDLVVVRPSASSGANGSGVELRDVDYLRRRALGRAHVPIVSTRFDPAGHPALAATREWLNEEAPFEATGTDVAPGFRLCTEAPRTILETGTDGLETGTDGPAAGGDDPAFRGVALHLDGDELRIVSQLRAGWNRYVVEWRLGADGVIAPGIGFAATANPATVGPHTHHAYLRLDFDVTGAGDNLVQEHNDPTLPATLSPWVSAKLETARVRDADHDRRWRVRHARTGLGYTVVPGPGDGEVDDFGAADVWLLAHHGDEVDDGQGVTTDPHAARVQLDRFVDGEQLGRADVVVWYGVHVPGGGDRHDPPALVGPRLEPFNWKAPSEEGPYAPLVPPSRDEPLPVIPT